MIRNINSNPLPRYKNASDDRGVAVLDGNNAVHHHSRQGGPGRRLRVKREDISAALSENITMILEDLLKDYDKTERPAFKQGTFWTRPFKGLSRLPAHF